ncbi:MAG: DUF2029 domain-containing protein [Candidatus Altiarchaeales archaeon]|nr:DUF2029 domain-containing protein [Candidatus Altiarchaeales archaeon]MBD3415645.1 DUF2029 domain-containing protein [Candidatus Altiarchaeales archaeon]
MENGPLKIESIVWQIVILSLFTRLLIAPFYVDPPSIPHDMWVYFGGGECVIEQLTSSSDCLETIHLQETYGNLYGILFNLIAAVPAALFPRSYLAMKIPGILFDCASIPLVYLIAERLYGKRRAVYSSLVYGFGYIPFYSSSVLGNDDNIFVFFILACTYLLIRERFFLAGVSFSLALALKMIAGILLVPVVYYILRKGGARKLVVFGACSLMVFSAFFIPHYLIAGEAALAPYMSQSHPNVSIFGVGFLNIVRLSYGLPYHLMHPEMPRRYADSQPLSPLNYHGDNQFSAFLRAFSGPFMLLGVLATIGYMLKYRLSPGKGIGLEMVRNSFFFLFVPLMFSKIVDPLYFQWALPYLIILFAGESDYAGDLASVLKNRTAVNSYILAILSAFVFSAIYRWSDQLDPLQKIFLAAGMLGAAYSTYMISYSMGRRERVLLSALTFVFAMDRVLHANILAMAYPMFSFIADKGTFLLMTRFGWNYLNAVLLLTLSFPLVLAAHRSVKRR